MLGGNGVFGTRKQVEQSSDNRCVLWRTARVLVFESSFKWHTFSFLMLFCSNSAHFPEIQLVCDGPTDRPTNGRTDTPSYRNARTHLKNKKKKTKKKNETTNILPAPVSHVCGGVKREHVEICHVHPAFHTTQTRWRMATNRVLEEIYKLRSGKH